jgi:hypothetical protein
VPLVDRATLFSAARGRPRGSRGADVAALAALPEAAPAALAGNILAAEALRRRAIDDAGDPDRPIARALRRLPISAERQLTTP